MEEDKIKEEKQTIHEFDLNIIREFFSTSERQGPGSPEETLKALSFIEGLTDMSKIADVGCGKGVQTIVLGQNTPCEITGVDIFADYVNLLNHKAQINNLKEKVKGVVGNMEKLPFQEREFDLIWSEGAIYNIGFERGISEWRKFLKQGGYIVVSENTWFTNERPAEIQDFWERAYPEIDTIPNKISQMQNAGYLPIATFIMPETSWLDYYSWQASRREYFLEKYKGNKAVEQFVASQQYEADLYCKYNAFYGFAFFIGKRI